MLVENLGRNCETAAELGMESMLVSRDRGCVEVAAFAYF